MRFPVQSDVQFANVFRRQGALFISPASQTDAGLWIPTDPIKKLDEEDTRVELGEAILVALSLSVPHPIDPDERTSSLLEMAGVQSWSKFESAADLVTVESSEGYRRIHPWKKNPGGAGFLPNPSKEIVLVNRTATAEDVGAAVIEAFRHCR